MWALGGRLLTIIGGYASLAVLAGSFRGPDEALSTGQVALIITALGLGLVAVAWEVNNYRRARPWVRLPEKVPDFMRKWLDEGGRVAIFSRDLSWVDHPLAELLDEKARRNELMLVLPRPIELSAELKNAGAEAIYYEDIDYVIKSRFTIANLDRADMAVAVGYRLPNGKHRIDQFHAGKDPAFYLAQDIVELLRRMRGQEG